MTRRKSAVLTVALLGALWLVSIGAESSVDREIGRYHDTAPMLWIPSGKVLKELSFGYDGLLADLYWTRAVQYYGGQLRDHTTDFSLLAPLLNITATLDPQLLVTYYAGSFFLSVPLPRGAGEPQEAIALLKRGIAANPAEWRMWHYVGFVYYWNLKDYPDAAAAYLEGSKNPKAEPWMKVMAAVISQKGGNKETSQFLWTNIYNSAEDPTIRQNAKAHLDLLKATDDMDRLKTLVDAFKERTGRWPQSFQEMIAEGMLTGVPQDPRGIPYQLQAAGNVVLGPDPELQMAGVVVSPVWQ